MVQNHQGEWVAIRSTDGNILGYGTRDEILRKYHTPENVPVLITSIPETVEESRVRLIDGKVHYKVDGYIDTFGRPHFYSKPK